MANNQTDPKTYLETYQASHMERLSEFLRIPSISTDSKYLPQVRDCADWLAASLESLGMEHIQVLPTKLGHPVVYADSMQAGPGAPVMLVYGHYDVQPVDPLDKWVSPPFEPTIRGDRLYARGASDMKGQIMAVMLAIEAAMRTTGFPLNLKFLLEGQEEMGSCDLEDFIKGSGDLFRADFCLNPDAGMWVLDVPAITYGLRGMIALELRFYGPGKDLHSGGFGGTIHNPAQALSELIAGFHHPDGMVSIERFYDKVRATPADERESLERLKRDGKFFADSAGVESLWGEPDFTPFERTVTRPTLEVNGILSGYTGEGTKTIIPAHSMAKLSMRLVPDQDPNDILDLFREYLHREVPTTIRWELDLISGSHPARTDLDSRYIMAMERSLASIWNRQPVFQLSGGSIPAVAILQHQLGVESVLTGYGLPEDNVHSPNECLHLPTWRKGIESLVYFFNEFK